MPRYRKIPTSLWDTARFRALSRANPNAQTLALYLRAGPLSEAFPGICRVGPNGLAEALGWPIEDTGRVMAELAAQLPPMLRFDADVRLVWLPDALAENRPESPNVAIAWGTALAELPDSPVRVAAAEAARAYLAAIGPAYAQAFEKAFGQAFEKAPGRDFEKARGQASPNQEQKQEQKQEQEREQEQEEVPEPLTPARSARRPSPAGAGEGDADGPGDDVHLERDGRAEDLLSCLTITKPFCVQRWTTDSAREWARRQVDAFPVVDLPGEVVRAAAWLASNPGRAKQDHRRFLGAWFARAESPRKGLGAMGTQRRAARDAGDAFEVKNYGRLSV